MKSVWSLEIGRDLQGDVLVLTLRGRLGAGSAGDLTDTVLRAVDSGIRAVLVDLTAVDYMSSAGIIAIDAGAGRLRTAGGRLVLCCACDPVRLVLELGGLPGDVALEPTLAAGLERVRRERG